MTVDEQRAAIEWWCKAAGLPEESRRFLLAAIERHAGPPVLERIAGRSALPELPG